MVIGTTLGIRIYTELQVPACLARLSTEITKLEAALMEFIGVPN